MNAAAEQLIVDYTRLKKQASGIYQSMTEGQSTDNSCHCQVLENFLPASFQLELKQVQDNAVVSEKTSNLPDSVKIQLQLPDVVRHLVWELHSGAFIEYLEHMTGTELLLPDSHLYQGGLAQTWEENKPLHLTLGHTLQPFNFLNRVSLLINLSNECSGHCRIGNNRDQSEIQEFDCAPYSCVIFVPNQKFDVEFNYAETGNSGDQSLLLLHYYNAVINSNDEHRG